MSRCNRLEDPHCRGLDIRFVDFRQLRLKAASKYFMNSLFIYQVLHLIRCHLSPHIYMQEALVFPSLGQFLVG